MAWSHRLEDPIALPDGRTLITLADAARYIETLPKAEQNRRHWQTAIRELLIAADRGGILFLANAAMRQALNHDRPPRGRRAKAYRILK